MPLRTAGVLFTPLIMRCDESLKTMQYVAWLLSKVDYTSERAINWNSNERWWLSLILESRQSLSDLAWFWTRSPRVLYHCATQQFPSHQFVSLFIPPSPLKSSRHFLPSPSLLNSCSILFISNQCIISQSSFTIFYLQLVILLGTYWLTLIL